MEVGPHEHPKWLSCGRSQRDPRSPVATLPSQQPREWHDSDCQVASVRDGGQGHSREADFGGPGRQEAVWSRVVFGFRLELTRGPWPLRLRCGAAMMEKRVVSSLPALEGHQGRPCRGLGDTRSKAAPLLASRGPRVMRTWTRNCPGSSASHVLETAGTTADLEASTRAPPHETPEGSLSGILVSSVFFLGSQYSLGG